MKRRGDPLEVGEQVFVCGTGLFGTGLEINRMFVLIVEGNYVRIGLSMHPSSWRSSESYERACRIYCRSPEEAFENYRQQVYNFNSQHIEKKLQEIRNLQSGTVRLLCTELAKARRCEYPIDYEDID